MWFCSCTKFRQLLAVPWSTLSSGSVSGERLQRRFALSRGRTYLSRSLTRDFLLIEPYGNKKHFVNKARKLLRHEVGVNFLRQALAFHGRSSWVPFRTVFGLVHLLKQMASAWWAAWWVPLELSGHEWHEDSDVSYPNMVPQQPVCWLVKQLTFIVTRKCMQLEMSSFYYSLGGGTCCTCQPKYLHRRSVVYVKMGNVWEVVIVHLWHPLYNTLHSNSSRPDQAVLSTNFF